MSRMRYIDQPKDAKVPEPETKQYGLPAFSPGMEFECPNHIAGSLKRWGWAVTVAGPGSQTPAVQKSAAKGKSQSLGVGFGKADGEDEKEG